MQISLDSELPHKITKEFPKVVCWCERNHNCNCTAIQQCWVSLLLFWGKKERSMKNLVGVGESRNSRNRRKADLPVLGLGGKREGDWGDKVVTFMCEWYAYADFNANRAKVMLIIIPIPDVDGERKVML